MSDDAKKENNTVSAQARLGITLVFIFSIILFVSDYFNSPAVQIPFATVPLNASSSLEISHGDRTKKQVIFTFDGGAGANSADQILSVLAKHNVKGTFFLTGEFIKRFPNIVRKMSDLGAEIFNHTSNHTHLTKISDADIRSEFKKMEWSLQSVIGNDKFARPYFRAPYGDRDQRVLAIAYKEGYQSVYWTVDAGDWKESMGFTSDEVKTRILSNIESGNIFLMHLGDSIAGQVLDEVFTEIESRGYKIVSLTQGL